MSQVEKALRTVAKSNEEKELKTANVDTNLPENKDATAEKTQIKNNSKNNSALKGISQDLLNKVQIDLIGSEQH